MPVFSRWRKPGVRSRRRGQGRDGFDACCARGAELRSTGDQGRSARHKVVDDDRRTSAHPLDLRQNKPDLAIAAAVLFRDHHFGAQQFCDLLHPGQGFAVGTDQYAVGIEVALQYFSERWSCRNGCGGDAGDDLAERRDAVEMRVDGYEAIEMVGDEPADDALAHGFAGMEGNILPHIGEIGRDEHDAARAIVAQRRRGEQDFDQFRIGIVQ